jgi:hypothetical protein
LLGYLPEPCEDLHSLGIINLRKVSRANLPED